MTIQAATDARRESARGNGVAHAGQFGHQAHSAPAGFDDPAVEFEYRQDEIAGRLDEAMTSAHGPTFQSLRGIVETGEDGAPRLRVTETTVTTRWNSPAIADASIPERLGIDDFEGEIGQLYVDRASVLGGTTDEPVFEFRHDETGAVTASWDEDRSQDAYDEDELHDAEFHVQELLIDAGVAHARDDVDMDSDDFAIYEDSTVDTLSDARRRRSLRSGMRFGTRHSRCCAKQRRSTTTTSATQPATGTSGRSATGSWAVSASAPTLARGRSRFASTTSAES